MNAQITSFTDTANAYDVTINQRGLAIDCRCNSRHFNPGKQCKHMKVYQAAIDAEIARAALFLAMKRHILGMEETARANREMFYDARFQ